MTGKLLLFFFRCELPMEDAGKIELHETFKMGGLILALLIIGHVFFRNQQH